MAGERYALSSTGVKLRRPRRLVVVLDLIRLWPAAVVEPGDDLRLAQQQLDDARPLVALSLHQASSSGVSLVLGHVGTLADKEAIFCHI
jgi:hypothetical protein